MSELSVPDSKMSFKLICRRLFTLNSSFGMVPLMLLLEVEKSSMACRLPISLGIEPDIELKPNNSALISVSRPTLVLSVPESDMLPKAKAVRA